MKTSMLWKDYLRFHLIEHYASVLPKAVAAEDFAFYGTILSGAQHMPGPQQGTPSPPPTPLSARPSANSIRNVISRPKPRRKRKPWSPILITAYRARISNLTWMSPQTKEKGVGKAGRASHRRRLS